MKKIIIIILLMTSGSYLDGMERKPYQSVKRVDTQKSDNKKQAANAMLFQAAQTGDHKLCVKAVAEGADIHAYDDEGNQPAHVAAREGHFMIIRWLQFYEADLNAANKHGIQPVYLAADNGHRGITMWLLVHRVSFVCLSKGMIEQFVSEYPFVYGVLTGQTQLTARNLPDLYTEIFLEGAKIGDLDLLQAALLRRALIHAKNNLGMGAMEIAASNGHSELLGCLFEHGADIHARSYTGSKAIHAAAINGSAKMLDWLVKHGANIRAFDQQGTEPIIYALQHKNLEAIEWLLVHGALPLWTEEIVEELFKQTPLIYEVLSNQNEKANDRLSRWNNGQEPFDPVMFKRAFLLMIAFSRYDLINVILQEMPDKVTLEIWQLALETAATVPSDSLFNLLYRGLQQKVRASQLGLSDYWPLLSNAALWAELSKNIKVLEVIRGILKLSAPAKNSRPGEDRGKQKQQARANNMLFAAVRDGSLQLAERALCAGAEVNARDGLNQRPIDCAVISGDVRLLGWLIDHGADIGDARNAMNIIYAAANHGKVEILKWLKSRDIDSKRGYANEITLVHAAAISGSLETLEWLFSLGSNVKGRSSQGQEPIFAAAKSGKIDVIRWLIIHGASANGRDKQGECPADAALAFGQINALEWLLEHGAFFDLNEQRLEMLMKNAPLIYEIIQSDEQMLNRLQTFDLVTFNRAFLLLIAQGRIESVDFILSELGHRITSELWRAALEIAAAVNNLSLFRHLYQSLSESMEANQITDHQFVAILENALFWAVIARSEDIVHYILEKAFVSNRAPRLSLARTGAQVNFLLRQPRPNPAEEVAEEKEREETPTESRDQEVLLRIRQSLLNAARVREAASIALQPSEGVADGIYRLIPQLPAEAVALILGYFLHPSKP